MTTSHRAPRAAKHQRAPEPDQRSGTSRRRFLGYLIAAPTLVAAVEVGSGQLRSQPAGAAIVSPPEPADVTDLGDVLVLAAMPTSNLISVQINTDGTASFVLPRIEVGQGLTTAVAMLIAEELDVAVADVQVSLSDANPQLLFNQLTSGSASIRTLYTPVRRAAAIARTRLVDTAAALWKVPASKLSTANGVISGPGGRSISYGALAQQAAVNSTKVISAQTKSPSEFTIIGTSQPRIDALEAVTGRKTFVMDLQIPGALPTMVCRPPTINGTVVSAGDLAPIAAMPGITDVVVISTGVAVRGQTFGQCIDAVRALGLQVTWGPGSEDGKSDADILAELRKAEIPLLVPDLKKPFHSIDGDFTFYFRSTSPLETNAAIADVRADSAEIWSPLKSPITAQARIAEQLGMAQTAVTVHVVPSGGSFGRHLFWDAALEAAEISQAIGKPVKLMWHRTDDFRHGRTHPMSTSRVRVAYSGDNVYSYEQRHTSVSTDFTHGIGEILTAIYTSLPGGNFSFAEGIFELTQTVSYNFGLTTQLLNEVDMGFHTGSMRNIYSPDMRTAQELMVDATAAAMGKDPYQFRRAFLKEDRFRAVLDKAAEVGNWGRTMAPGTAQGIALHAEYKGVDAALVEIDCTPQTVHRVIANGVGGPRVTKVVFVVDVGFAINPLGLQAQMLGGIMDGIAQALTSSLHFCNGIPLEGSWDNYFYTRQWNVPTDVQIIVMPPTTGKPGGAGEFGVAASMAATACAYWRATGTMPTSFPINHNGPLGFSPLPLEPPIPLEPTDGLANTF